MNIFSDVTEMVLREAKVLRGVVSPSWKSYFLNFFLSGNVAFPIFGALLHILSPPESYAVGHFTGLSLCQTAHHAAAHQMYLRTDISPIPPLIIQWGQKVRNLTSFFDPMPASRRGFEVD